MRKPSRKPPLVQALAAAVVVAAAVGLITSSGSSARQRPRLPRGASVLTVSETPYGRAIPSGFLGFSFEYNTIEPYAGEDPAAINPVLEQLIRNLTPGQSPVIRIGGDTTDWTWWPVRGMRKPPGIRYTLNGRWLRVTAALTEALGARLILGINLEADSAKLAATEARALISGIGRGSIEALELGNEPELYASFGWYKAADGQEVPGRPPSYDFGSYIRDWARIGAALPDLPLAGPAIGAPAWMARLGRFLAGEPRLRLATLHRYPLRKCQAPAASPTYPTIPHLLSVSSQEGLADGVAPYAALAHADHIPLRIDELNSASCGGTAGVSNVSASALWALDTVFAMARAGVDGVNIHTFQGAKYELFAFTHKGGQWHALVTPEYYGLLLFAQAAPPGARLLETAGTLGRVRAWATHGPDRRTRVVLINEYTAQTKTVVVRVAGARGTASLELLRTPGPLATTGLTLGGQSFGSSTSTGLLSGRSRLHSLRPVQGAYVVRLPPAGAAMLTLPGSRGPQT